VRRKVFPLVVLGAVAAALATALPALADQPVVTVTTVDHSRTIPASPDYCPFPFVLHTQGTYHEAVYPSGKDVTWAVDFHITYTNPANGKSVTSAFAGPFTEVPNPDGTITVTVDGNNGHFTASGQGTLWAEVGRVVYIADPSDPYTPLEALQSTGQQDPLEFPAVCAGLS
jgi:hypothetical protein